MSDSCYASSCYGRPAISSPRICSREGITSLFCESTTPPAPCISQDQPETDYAIGTLDRDQRLDDCSITYLNTSAFSLYLIPFLFKRWNARRRLGRADRCVLLSFRGRRGGLELTRSRIRFPC